MTTRRNPISADAKLAFKGILFEVWQWQQEMFDGSVQTFERLRRPNTAQVVATAGDKILTLLEEQPDARVLFPSLPGGRFDEGEEPLAAAKRELLEETGYVSDDWELWFDVNPVGKIEWTVYNFIARNCRKVAEPSLDAGEKITLKLATFEEFLAYSDDDQFYAKEIVEPLLRARLDAAKLSDLKARFFGTHG